MYNKFRIYDRNSDQQSKWNKAFGARAYYVAIVGNVTEDAIKRYIQEQSEESWEKDSERARRGDFGGLNEV